MVKISVEFWSEEDLRNKFDALARKGDWDKECEKCKNPELLHKANCARKVEVGEAEFSELWKVWSAYRERMEPKRKQFDALPRKGDWDKECEKCKNLESLHKANCARKVQVGEAEFSEV